MIPVFKPSYGEEELEALREPLKSGWVGLGYRRHFTTGTSFGRLRSPKTKEFEEKFAEYIGVKRMG